MATEVKPQTIALDREQTLVFDSANGEYDAAMAAATKLRDVQMRALLVGLGVPPGTRFTPVRGSDGLITLVEQDEPPGGPGNETK